MQKSSLDSQSEELAKVRQERQQALAKLNQDYKARDQKMQARQQDQADLAKVLKTIEETLARQAREAEEARQKALVAAHEAEEKRQREAEAVARNNSSNSSSKAMMNRHRVARSKPPAQSFPVPEFPTADLLHRPRENFHGLSMVDCLRVSVKPAVMTNVPNGTAS